MKGSIEFALEPRVDNKRSEIKFKDVVTAGFDNESGNDNRPPGILLE